MQTYDIIVLIQLAHRSLINTCRVGMLIALDQVGMLAGIAQQILVLINTY